MGELSVLPPIAVGATAEVYSWGEGRVLKLYRDGFPPDEAEQEARRARAASACGVRTPAVLDVITVEGRQGIVYERVEGVTLLQALLTDPERGKALAAEMAALQAAMHDCVVEGLPALRERLQRDIQAAGVLPESLRKQLLTVLERLPEGHALCHGDLHPQNILLTDQGPVLIDWVNATQGPPLADVARTRLHLLFDALPEGFPQEARRRIELLRAEFCAAYLHRYRQLRPCTQEELDVWLPPVAAARLS